MIKHSLIVDIESYIKEATKKGSVSIEMKMIVDDASEISPFVKMFSIEDFRDMNARDVEDIIMDNANHIARTFYGALHNRTDCLDAEKKK